MHYMIPLRPCQIMSYIKCQIPGEILVGISPRYSLSDVQCKVTHSSLVSSTTSQMHQLFSCVFLDVHVSALYVGLLLKGQYLHHFHLCPYAIRLFTFSVYDPRVNCNLATRRQIPLKAAFVITVHKAQGLTLDCVAVDCHKQAGPARCRHRMCHVAEPITIDKLYYCQLQCETARVGLQVLRH